MSSAVSGVTRSESASNPAADSPDTQTEEQQLVTLGDSITDGRGSTTNGNDRWPDQLFARRPRTAVLNQAAGGNRVLNDGLGPSVLSRVDRDILAQSGIRWLIVFAGVMKQASLSDTPMGTPEQSRNSACCSAVSQPA